MSMYVYMLVESDGTGTQLKITWSWIRISIKFQITVQPPRYRNDYMYLLCIRIYIANIVKKKEK